MSGYSPLPIPGVPALPKAPLGGTGETMPSTSHIRSDGQSSIPFEAIRHLYEPPPLSLTARIAIWTLGGIGWGVGLTALVMLAF